MYSLMKEKCVGYFFFLFKVVCTKVKSNDSSEQVMNSLLAGKYVRSVNECVLSRKLLCLNWDICVQEMKETRPVGRPRRRWKDIIRRGYKGISCHQLEIED